MPKPILSTMFWRPVNLLRSKEARAASRHTSPWGLNRLLRRSAILARTVHRNLEDRLLSMQIELPELVKLAVKGGAGIRKVACEIILDQNAFHSWAVRELAQYLTDNKLNVEGSFELWGKREVEYVAVAFPVRQRAQQLLRHIARLHDDDLSGQIRKLLAEAPSAQTKDRLIF